MTQATDIDMRELKSAIEANSRQMAELTTEVRVGFANIDAKFANVDTKFANVTANVDAKFANVDIKFANVDTKFANVDTKLADIRGEITEVRGDIKALDSKFDERTKGFAQRLDNKEFIIRSTIAAVLSGLLLTFTKFLFFGLTA
jgi:Skp family chaperone for outer membrane proteins